MWEALLASHICMACPLPELLWRPVVERAVWTFAVVLMNMHAWLNASMHVSFRANACSSWDLHSDRSTLDGYQILVLAGHDEYWSMEMRDTVETFVHGGGHVA